MPFLHRMELDRQRDEVEAARRDPVKHKLSRLMEDGDRYRYWPGGKDGRGRLVRFCYSTGRNVAGYYLAWREVVTPVKRKGKPKEGDLVATTARDQWAARKLRRGVRDLSQRRAEAFKERQAKKKTSKKRSKSCPSIDASTSP